MIIPLEWLTQRIIVVLYYLRWHYWKIHIKSSISSHCDANSTLRRLFQYIFDVFIVILRFCVCDMSVMWLVVVVYVGVLMCVLLIFNKRHRDYSLHAHKTTLSSSNYGCIWSESVYEMNQSWSLVFNWINFFLPVLTSRFFFSFVREWKINGLTDIQAWWADSLS